MPKDMTPPTKKEAKAKKAPAKKAAAPAGERKRAPRVDYGYLPGAKIDVDKDKEHKFRGQTLEWFERLSKSNGKTVEHFIDGNQGVTNNKGNPESPRGWLAHFCKAGYASLSGGKEPTVKAKES